MLLNFALDFLGIAVSCDKVSSDSYECTNLIATDFLTRRRGYLAEHFIKPPVHVTFTFPCNINISHIILDPYVGQQQSVHIDLLCATKPSAQTSHGKLKQQEKLFKSNQSFSNEVNLPAFYQVSRITNCTRSRVCFYSSRFRQRESNVDRHYMEYQTKSEMRHSKGELLTNASHIMVKVVRTQKGSTPSFSNIEIWGCVSSSVCREIRHLLEEKYINFVTPRTTSSVPTGQNGLIQNSSSSSSSDEKKNSSSLEGSDGVDIPEEFVDPLTCEIMTIPMLLPCGKHIDKSSLDRFSDTEASHGRHPRDPYTGIEFSAAIRPIPNVDLKARIDAFLMSNSNIKSISTMPRTVRTGKSSSLLGKRKVDDRVMQVSSLVALDVTQDKKLAINDPHENDKGDHCVKVKNDNGSERVARATHIESSNNKKVVKNVQPHILNNDASVNNIPSTSKVYHQASSENELHKSHDDRLKDSLDSALSSILPSFSKLKDKRQPTVSSFSNECFKCGTVIDPGNIAYKTPCSHLICRQCLVLCRDQEVKCLKCGTNFKKIDVARSHQ